MSCKHGCLPFVYWGLPIGGDMRKLWNFLVDRIKSRLSGWKSKNFSLEVG